MRHDTFRATLVSLDSRTCAIRKLSSMRLFIVVALLVLSLTGCATLSGRDAPTVRVVGLEPLASEGMEVRFALKIRVMNPNDSALTYNGISVNLDLDGRGLASGVSDESGEISRFSDAVLTIPVSISAFSAFRQIIARVNDAAKGDGQNVLEKPISYNLTGKLAGAGTPVAVRFSDSGELSLFSDNSEKQVTE